jgi:hypothetical protein
MKHNNINAMNKSEYLEFLNEKGVLNFKNITNNLWNKLSSKKELAFLESGYPFEKNITYEQALNTRAKWMGFKQEFPAYGVKDMSIFQQVKDMAEWKNHLSLTLIRYSIWEQAT